MGKGIGSLYA